MSRSNSFLNKTPTLVKCWVICLDEDAVEQEMIYLSLFVAQLTKLPVIMDCFFFNHYFLCTCYSSISEEEEEGEENPWRRSWGEC